MVNLPVPPFSGSASAPREWAVLPYDLRFPSDVRFVERAVELVVDRCRSAGFPAHALAFNVRVALTEALSNAILYGNREDESKAVRVTASLTDAGLVLEVYDQGTGFNLDECTNDPTRLENLLREDGRGLFLMRRLMDRVEQVSNGDNMVRLTLRRT
ncbi:MAG TPA: ATP-binding protein [Gemmatimonadaceae bacterium]|nr:ATP-binding protein [Gemmatimonadaceae bacterium]